jgi:hypothetical protein
MPETQDTFAAEDLTSTRKPLAHEPIATQLENFEKQSVESPAYTHTHSH